MRFRYLLILLSFPLVAEVPGFNGKPITTDDRIALYEGWVAGDPANVANQTLLAGAYLQKTRETTDFSYLDKASKIVDRILLTKKDYEALRLRNLIELNRHHFSKVIEYAAEMTRANPSDPQTWGSLGDALMESGQYEPARAAFEKMLSLRPNLFSYNRMAYLRFLNGDVDGGIAMMTDAVKAGARYPENKSWCLVELGNMYFKTGRREEAERAYREAIELFPSSHAAHAALGAVQAAKGSLPQAIASYKRAQAITPMVQYAGVLHDLYAASGNKIEARRQAEMVDLVARLEEAANQKANRTLSLIYANQERNLAKSLELAEADLQVRQDVFTYDAYAWALLKNKRYDEAWKASEKAMALGTPEAMFFYHAGMIANARADKAASKQLLEKALKLNDGFDIRQAGVARQALSALQ
ncbi:MAG: tetratricopeptide repeat protein [Bryobacteraceae bacterium]